MEKILFIITILVSNGLYTLNTNTTTVVPQTNSTEVKTSDTGGENDQDPEEDEDPIKGQFNKEVFYRLLLIYKSFTLVK